MLFIQAVLRKHSKICFAVGLVVLVLGFSQATPFSVDSNTDSLISVVMNVVLADIGCCDGGGDYGGGGQDCYLYINGCNPPSGGCTVNCNPPPHPSCDSFTASPNTLPHGGGNVTLVWNTTNATSVSISGIGSVAVDGSTVVAVSNSQGWTLVASGAGGTATCVTNVTVQPPAQNPPACTLYANPTSVEYGGSSTLTWTSTNATSAVINQGIGSVALNGSHLVTSLITTRTYTLTVTGPGGTANCSTTIVVQQQQVPSCTISANPTNVNYGGSSTITWTSTNATSATLTDFGSVALNGSQVANNITSTRTYVLTVTGPGGTANCQTTVTTQQQQIPSCTIYANPSNVQYGGSSTITWSSTNATSATLTDFGSVAVNGSQIATNITGTRTYVLTVTGPGGTANCQTTVTTQQNQPLSCTIYANPTNIQQGGSSYLTWSSNGATSANLTNHGSVGVNGSQTVYPYQTTTYVLTVYNAAGQSAQCQTTIYLGTVYNQPPTCWINLSNYNYQQNYGYNYDNQQALLTWGSTNATSAYITPNIGNVGTSGSRTVYSYGNQTYTLTVTGPGGTATCQTVSTYVPPVQPPYVTLTQIPYTGAVGSFFYWFSLVTFSLAAAYLAVYYLPMFAGIKARVPEEVMEAPMVLAKSVAASMPSFAQATAGAGWMPKDAMTMVRSENERSMPKIVITRN